ncbi:MAG TPA: DUF2079 domain-containing protein [bacterium]|nr:DUF2079 domain-containing protein [bacterium]
MSVPKGWKQLLPSLLVIVFAGWNFAIAVSNKGMLLPFRAENASLVSDYREVWGNIFWFVPFFITLWLVIGWWVSRDGVRSLADALERDAFRTLPLLLLVPLAWFTSELGWSLSSRMLIVQIVLGVTMVLRLSEKRSSCDLHPAIAKMIIILAGFAFAIVVSRFAIHRHREFHTYAFDLGMVSNIVWNTSRGRLFQTSLFPWSILGEHLAFVYVLFAPLYWLWEDPRMLIIVQALLLGLSGVAFYLLSQRVLRQTAPAFCLALAYLLHPGLRGVGLTEVHEVAFFPLLFFSALYVGWPDEVERRWTSGKSAAFLILLFGAVACREDTALLVAALGIYLILGQNRTRLGIGIVVGALAWYILATGLVIPFFRGKPYSYTVRYAEMGGTFGGMISTAIANPVYTLRLIFSEAHRPFLWQALGSVLFVALLSGWACLMLLLALAACVLASEPQQYSLLSQYPAVWLPVVFVTVLLAMRRLAKVGVSDAQDDEKPYVQKNRLRSSLKPMPIAMTLLALAVLTPPFSVVPPWKTMVNSGSWSLVYPPQPFGEDARTVLARFTDRTGSVSAQTIFVPHVASRSKVFQFPDGLNTDYILVDIGQSSNSYPLTKEELRNSILTLLKQGTYQVKDRSGSVCLLSLGGVPTEATGLVIRELEAGQ